jgi:hypothetical protein
MKHVGSFWRLPGDCSNKPRLVMGLPVEQRCSGWFVVTLIAAVVISSDALSQQSLQELESTSQFEQALAAVDAIKNRKRVQCVLAIANRAVCECLSLKLPVDTYFRSYASIVNQEKEGPEYGQLSAADKKILDQCVNDSR